MKIIKNVFMAIIFPVFLFGCVPPPNNAAYQPSPGYQQPVDQQQVSQDYDIDGVWCFVDNRGRHDRNIIKRVQGGIYASPYGRRGKSVIYKEVAPNLFSSRGAQYLFFSDRQGRWKSSKYDWSLTRCN